MNLLASNSKTKTEKKGKVAYVYKSCRAYPTWVMSHVRMSHFSHLNELVRKQVQHRPKKKMNSHICAQVLSRIFMGYVTRMNESFLNCE